MKKIVIISVLVIVLAVVGYIIFKPSGDENGGIKLVEATKGTIVDKALAVGQLEPRREIQVKSKISGIVKKLHVDISQVVRAGDPLITVAPNPTPLEYAEAKRYLELAEVDFENARLIYERKKGMYEKNLISKEEYEINLTEYNESDLRLKLAQEKFRLLQQGDTSDGKNENTILSPINGTVLEKLVNEGDPVVPLTSYQAGTPLLALAPMDELIFKGTVDEIDVGKLTEGMTANLKVGALPDTKLEGKLSKISPKARKENNTTLFDIEIEVNKDDSTTLRAGYSANADLIINQKDSVIVIPERLVNFAGDTASVEVQDSAGLIDTVEVKVGLSDGLNIEVMEGLALGDQVVERPPKEIGE
jgi:HlyD family secretion protein